MGKIAPFIDRALAAGLRNQCPSDNVFLAEGEGVCLIISESLADERDLGFALCKLVFGTPSAPDHHPPCLALRLFSSGWRMSIESEGEECPTELLDFARACGALASDKVAHISPETCSIVFGRMLDRVTRSSLANAS
jgi:hypothetical protein